MRTTTRKNGQDAARRHGGIDPTVKAWIDRVVVPTLVREFLAEREKENPLAPEARTVAECPPSSTATAEVGR